MRPHVGAPSLAGALRQALFGTLVVAGALTAGPPAALATTGASAGPLTISPAPGTPDVSPQTQISILGAAPRTIRSVRVTGSASGVHAGRLRPYSGGRGASFVLAGTAPRVTSPLLDSIVQEVDIRTGLVVWEWHGLGHIPLADSYATPASSAFYDVFHINSIQLLPGDRALVSARDTSAVYEIDRASSRIVWTLGGKASSFRLGPGPDSTSSTTRRCCRRVASACLTTRPARR